MHLKSIYYFIFYLMCLYVVYLLFNMDHKIVNHCWLKIDRYMNFNENIITFVMPINKLLAKSYYESSLSH